MNYVSIQIYKIVYFHATTNCNDSKDENSALLRANTYPIRNVFISDNGELSYAI